MFFDFVRDLYNYEERKVGRDDANGIGISTVYTSDEGFETALLDANGTHPVERYLSKEESIEGHAKWIELVKGGLTTVTKLGGMEGFVDSVEITLSPRS